NQPGERGQLFEVRGGCRPLPDDLEVRPDPWRVHEVEWTVADHLESDVDVSIHRVADGSRRRGGGYAIRVPAPSDGGLPDGGTDGQRPVVWSRRDVLGADGPHRVVRERARGDQRRASGTRARAGDDGPRAAVPALGQCLLQGAAREIDGQADGPGIGGAERG